MPLATDPWNCRNQTVNRAHSLETPLSQSRPYFPRSIVQVAAWLLLIGGIFAGGPAIAQFGGIFGDAPPPRPPADVPTGPFPAQPPPVGGYPEQAPQRPDQQPYPQQGHQQPYQQPYPRQGQQQPYQQPYPAYPSQGSPGYPSQPPYPAVARPVEAQPLPPPPGASVPPAPGQAPQRPLVPTPPAQRGATAPAPANSSPPTPAAAAAPPEDDTVVEAPTPHIDNGRAVFSGLDKITGRTTSFDAAIGETVQFGALQVTPRACYTRPATEATNTDAFVEVDEVTLQGDIKRIFTGWMFASSPGLHAVEHPIYDVWLMDCSAPVQTSQAEPAAPPAPPPATKPVRRPPARQQRPAARAPSAVEAQPR